ncbi:MAG: prepilin-type N-terminal cleavage/methylation domain-containing protein [Nitrospirota bacterium]
MINVKKREDGFSLLEIMISIGILSILFVTLLGLRNRDIDINSYSRYLTSGTILARQKMAETELKGFPELGELSGDFGEEYPNFSWITMVSPTIFEPAREVNVTVNWKRGKKEESVTLTTYMVQR